jgi:hypothetical protein
MESTNSLTEYTLTVPITHGVFITGLLSIERTISSLHSDHVAARSAVLRLVRSRIKIPRTSYLKWLALWFIPCSGAAVVLRYYVGFVRR